MPAPDNKAKPKGRVSQRDIAAAAGVCLMTVSLSLRDNPKISQVTLKRAWPRLFALREQCHSNQLDSLAPSCAGSTVGLITAEEPPASDSPLFKLRNVVLAARRSATF